MIGARLEPPSTHHHARIERTRHEHPGHQRPCPRLSPHHGRNRPVDGDDAGYPVEIHVPDEPDPAQRHRQRDLRAAWRDARDRGPDPRSTPDRGDGHAARQLGQRDGLSAYRRGQGARARRAEPVGVLRRPAGAAGDVQGAGRPPVDPQHPVDPRPDAGGDGPPDPAARPVAEPRPRGELRPLDPALRAARKRQVVDLERHPRCDGRQDLRAPRAGVFRPGHHRL